MENYPRFDFDFTEAQLAAFLNNNRDTGHWYHALQVFLPRYEITTQLRVAAFLAQTHHESAGYTALSENLNYRWTSLRKVFPKYFPTDDLAKQYERQPQRIANRVYANRMGNGPESSGDGWRYRGKGLIQLTGKNNQSRFAEDNDMLLEDVPDYLSTFDGAVHSACWFWQVNNLNYWSDTGNIVQQTRVINGGQNGLDDRIAQYTRALQVLRSSYTAGVPMPVLSKGSTGEFVHILQEALGLTSDGQFGPATERAVVDWQRKRGMVADGIVGPVTWSQLLGR